MLTGLLPGATNISLGNACGIKAGFRFSFQAPGICLFKAKVGPARLQVFGVGVRLQTERHGRDEEEEEEAEGSDEEETGERYDDDEEDDMDVADDEEEENDEIGRIYENAERSKTGSIDFRAAQQLLEAIAVLKDAQTVRVGRMVKGWMKSRDDIVDKAEILYVMRRLRKRNRSKHALKIADWMALTRPRPYPYNARDHIFRLELCSRVGSVNKAERIFQRIPPQDRSEVAYNALLLGYVRNKKLNSAERLFRELKDSGLITCIYSFNLMASLYRDKGMEARVPWLQEEAEKHGLKPDLCFYNNLLAATFKLEGLERAEEVYNQILAFTHRQRFFTFLAMANCYMSAERKHKAEELLLKIEQGMESGQILRRRRRYNVLISMYAILGNVNGMQRTWERLTQLRTPVTEDYCCMIKSWGKVGQPEHATKLFSEAEAREKSLKHSAIFNSMMFVYSLLEMREEAEALAVRMEYELGIKMDPWCYHHLILLYAKQKDVSKMLNTMRTLQVLGKKEPRYRPLPASLWVTLNSLAEVGDVETAEELLKKWKRSGLRVNTSMYNRLLKAYLTAGKPVVRFVEWMLADGVRPNDETEQLYRELKYRGLVQSAC